MKPAVGTTFDAHSVRFSTPRLRRALFDASPFGLALRSGTEALLSHIEKEGRSPDVEKRTE
jgi:hypothetical protein